MSADPRRDGIRGPRARARSLGDMKSEWAWKEVKNEIYIYCDHRSRTEWCNTATVASTRAVFKSHYKYCDARRVDLEDLLGATRRKTANEADARFRSNLRNEK